MTKLASIEPNDVARLLTGRSYVSYSALATYQRCPLRYYFRYIAGLPEETVSASLVFGGAIHAALEHHFRTLGAGRPAPSIDDLVDAYQGAWRDRSHGLIPDGKEEDTATLADLARRMLTTFRASDLARPAGTILAVEDEIHGPLIPDVPDLLARVDLLVESGDELTITDFKTARSRWSTDQVEEAAEQLLLYANLVGKSMPAKTLRLDFAVITKTKSPVVERHPVEPSVERLARTRHIVKRVWRAIESGNFYPAPSPLNCPGCPFREPCRAWEG
jgi:CRISPR/Cas system-associated exonuclease Cas4 (RecB family)